jgi:small subunit ribosomal protein S16
VVKIRLMRMGAKKRPFYRVVVADSRSPRDGRFIENIGKYHPLQHPSLIEIDESRALHWLGEGAQPTQPVRVLFEKTGIWASFTGEEPPPPPTPEPKAEEPAPEEASSAAAPSEGASSEVPPEPVAPETAATETEAPETEAPEPEAEEPAGTP